MKQGTIPFPREFTIGAEGVDCRAVKRALAHVLGAKHGMNVKSDVFAATAGAVLADWKLSVDLDHDPIFTLQAHVALQQANAYDELGASLMNREFASLIGARLRAAIVATYRKMIAVHERYHYLQIRPIPLSTKPYPPAGVEVKTDCSGSIVLAAKWSNCPDPSGTHFSGQGNTGTFLKLPKITAAQAQEGDLIVYRRNQWDTYGHHAVLILERVGGDFSTGSDGHEGAPEEVLHSVELERQVALGYPDAVFVRFLPAV